MFSLSKIWWDFSRRWHNWVKSNQCSVSLPFRIATHAAPWRILKTVCLIQKCLNNYKRFRLEKDSFWHGMPVQIIALEVIYSLKITDTGLTLLPKPLGMGDGGWGGGLPLQQWNICLFVCFFQNPAASELFLHVTWCDPRTPPYSCRFALLRRPRQPREKKAEGWK